MWIRILFQFCFRLPHQLLHLLYFLAKLFDAVRLESGQIGNQKEGSKGHCQSEVRDFSKQVDKGTWRSIAPNCDKTASGYDQVPRESQIFFVGLATLNLALQTFISLHQIFISFVNLLDTAYVRSPANFAHKSQKIKKADHGTQKNRHMFF